MNILTATSQTQGWRDNDFCWTVEGELVLFPPIECGHGSIDDNCGCRRSMSGLVSHRATTTMTVADRDVDPDTYFSLISDGLSDLGYVTEELKTDREVNDWLHHLTDELLHLAGCMPPGTVVERRGESINVRRRPPGP